MKELEKAIRKYLKARKDLLKLSLRYENHFSGNDNIMGRIGEYIAIKYLINKDENPNKVKYSNNKGYDLIDGKKRTQVKLITTENMSGKTVRLAEPWDQFILIELDLDKLSANIGILSHDNFEKALKENKTMSALPIVKRTMLGKKGLIGKYGKVDKNYLIL